MTARVLWIGIVTFTLVMVYGFAARGSTAASTGVGISVSPVCLTTAAQPGHSYTLQTGLGDVQVENTGSSSESITLYVRLPLSRNGKKHFPPSWISVPSPVTLNPGQVASVPLKLTIPPGARGGTYGADLVASTMPVSGGSPAIGLATGAAAIDTVTFTVDGASSCGPDTGQS